MRLGLVAAGGALAGALALLFWFNPASHSFYPRCMFHAVTGLDCPGCGGLRATHQLLHGKVAEAFRLNPLLVCLLPAGVFLGGRYALARLRGKAVPTQPPARATAAVWVLAAMVVAFGVLRNLPWRAWVG